MGRQSWGVSAEGDMGVPAGRTRLLLLGAPVVVAATPVSSFLIWLFTFSSSFLSPLPLESLEPDGTPRQDRLVTSGLDIVSRGSGGVWVRGIIVLVWGLCDPLSLMGKTLDSSLSALSFLVEQFWTISPTGCADLSPMLTTAPGSLVLEH